MMSIQPSPHVYGIVPSTIRVDQTTPHIATHSMRSILGSEGGVSAIIIGSLIFLSVYAWVDTMAQVYKDMVEKTDTFVAVPHHTQQMSDGTTTALSALQKMGYAVLLTCVTIVVSLLLVRLT